MRVALDAMGGELGEQGELSPESIVASALAAMRADKDLRIIFVGDVAQLQPHLYDLGKLRDRVQTLPSSQIITPHEDLIQALRIKPDSSISRCWQLLAEKRVEAIVTPSAVPVVVAAGMPLRRFLPNVRRPGLAATIQTARGECVLIDAGAQTQVAQARPAHLYQFAVMGALFCRRVLRVDKPRIGLLTGPSADRGGELQRDTQKLIEASALQARFAGSVDVHALFHGAVDVVVCDGGTGGVTVGTHDSVTTFLAKLPPPPVPVPPTKGLGPARPRPLLGVDGICVLVPSHAGERGIGAALALAARMNEVELNQEITRELATGPLAGAPLED